LTVAVIRSDAGKRLGARGVDAFDVRVSIRTAEDFALQHSENYHIHGKLRLAGYLFNAIDSGNALAYVSELLMRHASKLTNRLARRK
jgi:hypothetical protein